MVDAGLFADKRLQLIQGEMIEMPAQYMPHMRAKTEVAFRLRDALLGAGSRLAVGIEGSVRLDDLNVPMPDVFVWDPAPIEKACPGERVRLVIEVCESTHQLDLLVKPGLYAAAAIPEYWIVDLRAKAVTVLWSPGAEGYREAQTVPLGGEARSPTLELHIATEGLL